MGGKDLSDVGFGIVLFDESAQAFTGQTGLAHRHHDEIVIGGRIFRILPDTDGKAAGGMIGDADHQGIAVGLGKIEGRLDGRIVGEQVTHHTGRIVGVGGPVNLRSFDKEEESPVLALGTPDKVSRALMVISARDGSPANEGRSVDIEAMASWAKRPKIFWPEAASI